MSKPYPKIEEKRIEVLRFEEANGFYTTPEKSNYILMSLSKKASIIVRVYYVVTVFQKMG